MLGVGADVLLGPGVQTIDRGIYLSADLELTPALRLSGYLQVLPHDTVVDSVTALQLHGVDVGPLKPYLFCTSAAHHPRRTSVRVRRVDRLPAHRGHVSSPVPARWPRPSAETTSRRGGPAYWCGRRWRRRRRPGSGC